MPARVRACLAQSEQSFTRVKKRSASGPWGVLVKTSQQMRHKASAPPGTAPVSTSARDALLVTGDGTLTTASSTGHVVLTGLQQALVAGDLI